MKEEKKIGERSCNDSSILSYFLNTHEVNCQHLKKKNLKIMLLPFSAQVRVSPNPMYYK